MSAAGAVPEIGIISPIVPFLVSADACPAVRRTRMETDEDDMTTPEIDIHYDHLFLFRSPGFFSSHQYNSVKKMSLELPF